MQPQSDTLPGVGTELMSDAKDVGSSAVNRLHSEVDARKGDAATQVKSVSTAIQSAAGNLDESTPAWLKSAFEQGAQQVQKFAETLEQKDSRQIVNQISDFARSSPGTFLAACAAAGFAAARIFKAGGAENTPTQPAFGGGGDFSNTSKTGALGTQVSPNEPVRQPSETGAFGTPSTPTDPARGQFA